MGNGQANLKIPESSKNQYQTFKKISHYQQTIPTTRMQGISQTGPQTNYQSPNYNSYQTSYNQGFATYNQKSAPYQRTERNTQNVSFTKQTQQAYKKSSVAQDKNSKQRVYQTNKNSKFVEYQPQSLQYGAQNAQKGSIGMSTYSPHLIQNSSVYGYGVSQNTRMSQMQMERQFLNETYGFPASIGKALIHRDAYKFGWKPEFSDFQGKIICPCCKQNVETINLSVKDQETTIFFKTKEQLKIQSGIALFFTFIKYIIFMCIIRSLTVDIFNIATSLLEGNYCQDNCSRQFYTYASVIYKYNREDLIITTNLLSMAAVGLLIIYFLIYRRIMYRLYDLIDQNNQTQEDFTLFVREIPILNTEKHNANIQIDLHFAITEFFERKIIQWIQNDKKQFNWFDDPSKKSLENQYLEATGSGDMIYLPNSIVTSVTLCNDLTKIEKIHATREDLMDEYDLLRKNQENLPPDQKDRYETIPSHIYYLNGMEIRTCESYANVYDTDLNVTHFIGSAFVSLAYQHFREFLIQQFQKDSTKFVFQGRQLKLERAFYPTQIKWENLKIKTSERQMRTAISFLILLVFLIVAFALLVVSDRLKNFLMKFIEEKGIQLQNPSLLTAGGMAVSGITTVVTLTINTLLNMFAKSLTQWQRHESTNNQKLSLTIKMVAAQFVNTVLIYYFIAEIVIRETRKGMITQDGLVMDISSLVVTSGMIQIATNLLNVNAVWRSVKLKWYFGDFEQKDEVKMHQIRVNKMYEYNEFDIAERYAYYILQLFTASFYSYLAPICAPAVAIICIFQYWVDKYNLFHRSSIDYRLSYTLSRNVVKIAEISVLIYAVGVLIFSKKINDDIHIFNIIGFLAALVYILFNFLLPYNIEKKIFRSYEEYEKLSFLECANKGKFQKTYWNENPATRLVYESLYSNKSQINYKQKPLYIINDTYAHQKRETIKMTDVKYDETMNTYSYAPNYAPKIQIAQEIQKPKTYNLASTTLSPMERQSMLRRSYISFYPPHTISQRDSEQSERRMRGSESLGNSEKNRKSKK